MFKILGGDGKEYGPVSTDTVREWILQGRASAVTPVRHAEAAEWQTLSAFPELAVLLPAAALPINVTIPTSHLAIWSLVLGVLGFFCLITGPVGVVLGFMARARIKQSEGRLGGGGLALGGIVAGGLSVLLIVGSVVVLLPAMRRAQAQTFQRVHQINCVNNLKQLGLAVRLYSGDNADIYPAATNWGDAILNNAGSRKIFNCPGVTNQTGSSYAFNALLSGMKEDEIAPDTVMLFESDAGWNASGGADLMITNARHGNLWAIAFADGSVQQFPAARFPTLRWNPISTNQSSTNNN